MESGKLAKIEESWKLKGGERKGRKEGGRDGGREGKVGRLGKGNTRNGGEIR